MTLMALPRILLFDREHYGFMSFYPTLPPLRPQENGYDVLIRTIELRGQDHTAPEQVGDPGQRTWCVRMVHRDVEGLEIWCVLFNGEWQGSYLGPSRGADQFFQVIQRIK